ncbi:MAG: hypothetical protein LUF26_04420 [Firmicutes bacterium]|nr:hypothetical protein [Bacillota bacterium]
MDNMNYMNDTDYMRDMSDAEFAKEIMRIYNEGMSMRDENDYTVNEIQMERFFDICHFFRGMIKDIGEGYMEPIRFNPVEERGSITVYLRIMDMWGKEIQEFCDVFRYASAVSMDPTTDGMICISISVPQVFIRKDEKKKAEAINRLTDEFERIIMKSINEMYIDEI